MNAYSFDLNVITNRPDKLSLSIELISIMMDCLSYFMECLSSYFLLYLGHQKIFSSTYIITRPKE